MDTQLKHRLTGAVILVALIVLLVPEMLSGPRAPSSAAGGPAISLPASGTAPVAPMRSIDIDLAEPAPAGTAAAPAAAAPETQRARTEPRAEPRAAVPPPAERSPVAPAAASTASPREPAAAAAPPVPTPRLPLTGRFVVQAGSFAARDSAESLAARLRREGFEVQVSAVQSGGRTLHRVRVGAASDRVAAEALLMRLRAAGHSGGVVAVQ